MQWEEFKQLLSGIGPDTPLGRIVQIRSETDPDRLKSYSPAMNRIRVEWRLRHAPERTRPETDRFLKQMEAAFLSMAKSSE